MGWIKDFFLGKARIEIEHNGNEFKSNVSKMILLSTREGDFEEMGIKEIVVVYNDGVLKAFDESNWHIHGNPIMKNVPKIKVIVIKAKDK